jgi:Protein of Unknown function (DUF2784)
MLSLSAMNTSSLLYQLLADLIVLAHVAFVVFAVLGGLLAARWRWLVWIHLPAVIWAAIVEIFGWLCPLTPLENWLRQRGGERGYASDFIGRYILPALYPQELTREVQIALGAFVILINLTIYVWIFRTKRTNRDS